jgi:hypothetical protein
MKDGGAAFPVLDGYGLEDGSSQLQNRYFGMSMRDYFAGQALIGLLSNPNYTMPGVERSGIMPYKIADAMITARDEDASDGR